MTRALLGALMAMLIAPAAAQPFQPGFEQAVTAEGLVVALWFPASGTPAPERHDLFVVEVVRGAPPLPGPWPLVALSHGTGGDWAGHSATGAALAREGFVVAAPLHPGDHSGDTSRAVRIEERAPALSAAITFALEGWRHREAVDAARVGALGYSAGGFTALAAAGARPDLQRLEERCATVPEGYVCGRLAEQPRGFDDPWPEQRDVRLRALVLAVPSLGYAFTREGLAGVRAPVQLWRADADRLPTGGTSADAVRALLPEEPEFHPVPGASHFAFLTPCAEAGPDAPNICDDPPGFDRPGFLALFHAEVARFFRERL